MPARDQALALTATVGAGVGTIYWFVNGELVDQGDPGRTVFLEPQPGTNTITVVDDAGRSESVTIVVRADQS